MASWIATKAAVARCAMMACAVVATAGTANATAALPTTGRYVGTATVNDASSACTNPVGTTYSLQLQINDATVTTTQVISTSTGPDVLQTTFNKNAGTRLNPKGKIVIKQLVAATSINGIYTGLYEPLDGNSFHGTFDLTFQTSLGSCVETVVGVFLLTANS